MIEEQDHNIDNDEPDESKETLQLWDVGDLEKLDEPVWCPFRSEVWLLIRPLSNQKQSEIIGRYTKEKWVLRGSQRVLEKKTNWDKVEKDTRDWVLADWKGIGSKGKPLSCDRPTKLKILDVFHEMRSYVMEKATDLEGLKQQAIENTEKNLP